MHAKTRVRRTVLFRVNPVFVLFFFLLQRNQTTRFQRGGCADDISMVYIKAVFVFSIRLIRTVTENTLGGCVLGAS